jgi:hypothetical protein
VAVTAVRDTYSGDCAMAGPGTEPSYRATVSVTGVPVTVAYHWTVTDPLGNGRETRAPRRSGRRSGG